MISSVTAPPPRTCRRSRTRTFLPAFARYAALTRPLWPPPITMTSYFCFEFTFYLYRNGRLSLRIKKRGLRYGSRNAMPHRFDGDLHFHARTNCSELTRDGRQGD